MENNLLNHKRERNPSDIQNEEDLDSLNRPKKEKKTSNVESPKNESKLLSKKEEKENTEENISELVFKLNSKSNGVECFICQKDISKNLKFLCEECGNKIFCVKCMIEKKHSPKHQFQVIDILNYSIFTDDWTVGEEYNLLQNLSTSGLNNWEDISNILGRGQVECESHYYSFYYKEKENPMPKEEDIILDDQKKIKPNILQNNKDIAKNKSKEITKSNGNNFPEPIKEVKPNKKAGRYIGLRKNLKPGEAETAAEILGCRPKRHEFETEFLNDTEIEISHLEFDDNDKEEDLKIKFDVLKDYNLRIKEREERKNFVFDKGLLDLRRENRIESKLNRDQFELLLFLKPFARFYENSEFFDLFEGICLEHDLKMALKNLNKLEKEKTNKGEKICSIEDIENFFDIDRNLKKTRKSGDFFTNIPEPKNIMTFLGHRLERFMQYQRDIGQKDDNMESGKKLFDDDEYLLVKEMPLARSTFYDIKLRAQNMVNKYKDQKSFMDNFNKLLEEYDLEEKTKNEISEFYMKKFKNNFEESNKIKDIKDRNDLEGKSLNSIYIEKYTNDKGKIINDNGDIDLIPKEQNNHTSKRIDYATTKENFKNELVKEDEF
jgi:transcriptional adapter 2-alpha